MRVFSGSSPHSRGSISEQNASSWARPIVATVSSSRPERKKRRMIASSTTAPTTNAATSPITSDST